MTTYLIHFGIKGQKWGKRNGPPYPLDYESHSAKQKKENPKGRLDNYKNNNPKIRSNNHKSNAKESINKSKGFKLTDKQKAAIIVAGTVLAAYGIYKLSSSEFKQKLIDSYTKAIFESKGINGILSSNPQIKEAYKDVLLADTKGKISDELYNRIRNGINTDPNNTLYDKNLWDNVLKSYEINNIKNYTGSLAKHLNNILRKIDDYEVFDDEIHNAMIKSISDSINKSELKEEVISFRNISPESFQKMFENNFGSYVKPKPGEIFKDNGFYSTSLLATYNIGGNKDDQIRLTTILPKGANALYLGDQSSYPYEKELLVQRGSNFKIHNIITDSDNKIKEIICELIK